uniref:Uncharacterized protein n=1 Tax=Panagrolaimus sp. JU765 TaxID=591449 RepID=A0AC34RA98_9BILA
MFRIRLLNSVSSIFARNGTVTNVGVRKMGDNIFASREEMLKNRRKYVMFGGVIMMFFGSHAILLWRRRSQYRSLNKEIPPMEFDDFVREYFATGTIKSLVFHPHFYVCDAYLETRNHPTTSTAGHQNWQDKVQDMGKNISQNSVFGPNRVIKPQARFIFKGSAEDLEKKILEVQSKLAEPSEIQFEVNRFPSYSELGFIACSVLFGACCVALAKI